MPAGFRAQQIATKGADIHVWVGGKGPGVLLLHGYGETSEMWGPLAAALVARRTVVAPDLRGLGLSSKPESGYDKATQAQDMRTILQTRGVGRAARQVGAGVPGAARDVLGDREIHRCPVRRAICSSSRPAPRSTAVITSLGKSRCTGPGLPEVATRKASCTTERTSSTERTW